MPKPHNGYANRFQRIACQAYPDGDLLPVDLEDGEAVAEAVKSRSTGDTLFDFVFIELGEDDLHENEALKRMKAARDAIFTVIHALEQRQRTGLARLR